MKGYDREEAVRSIVGAIDQKAYSDLGMSVEALVRQAIEVGGRYCRRRLHGRFVLRRRRRV